MTRRRGPVVGQETAGERPAGADDARAGVAARNEVALRGRVTSAPVVKELPSGSEVVTVRLSVVREQTPMTAGSRATSDWLDCSAWSPRCRRTVQRWRPGDVVEVEGALRRRFPRGGGVSRVEVEVLGARLVTRPREPPRPGAA